LYWTFSMDSYLEQLRRELEDTMAAAGPDGTDTPPAGKWSSSQILEHLYLTYLHTNKGMSKCLEKGKPMGKRPSVRDRLGTFLVLYAGYFPTGRKSPERAVPKGMAADEVRRVILTELQQMEAGLAECERRFGLRARILDHPALGPLNVGEWRKFHWVHGKHHARQIRERAGKTSG
jgi:hypothetical protein